MADNKGKEFEKRFYENWKSSFPGKFIIRLYDQVSRYKDVSKNPCDYISVLENKVWLLECKELLGNTLNFAKAPQVERMSDLIDEFDNVVGYLIIWFRSHDQVIMVPAKEALRMKKDGLKSINIKDVDSGKYRMIKIPSVKQRVFLDSDYKIILEDLKWQTN